MVTEWSLHEKVTRVIAITKKLYGLKSLAFVICTSTISSSEARQDIRQYANSVGTAVVFADSLPEVVLIRDSMASDLLAIREIAYDDTSRQVIDRCIALLNKAVIILQEKGEAL